MNTKTKRPRIQVRVKTLVRSASPMEDNPRPDTDSLLAVHRGRLIENYSKTLNNTSK